MSIHSITVYCSSSSKVPAVYFDAASELGTAIADNGWQLVYGGNDCGLMGTLADTVRNGGGRVIGITPRVLADKGYADARAHELIITDGMRDRKAMLEARADAFITLPGGFGTFEEVFEIIVGRQLAFHDKPIVLLNIAGYYTPLLAMIQQGIEQQFIRPDACNAYRVFDQVGPAIDYLKSLPAAVNGARSVTEPSALE